jgi:hypothetical protein
MCLPFHHPLMIVILKLRGAGIEPARKILSLNTTFESDAESKFKMFERTSLL